MSMILFVCLLFVGLLSGCSTEGASHFLTSGETEYFLTMNQGVEEAKTTYADGKPKYSGYECRSKFLGFTIEKRDYYEGRLVSRSGQ